MFLIAGLICVIMGVFFLALDYAALVVLAKDHGIIITGIINIVIGVIALAEYLGHKLNKYEAQQGGPACPPQGVGSAEPWRLRR